MGRNRKKKINFYLEEEIERQSYCELTPAQDPNGPNWHRVKEAARNAFAVAATEFLRARQKAYYTRIGKFRFNTQNNPECYKTVADFLAADFNPASERHLPKTRTAVINQAKTVFEKSMPKLMTALKADPTAFISDCFEVKCVTAIRSKKTGIHAITGEKVVEYSDRVIRTPWDSLPAALQTRKNLRGTEIMVSEFLRSSTFWDFFTKILEPAAFKPLYIRGCEMLKVTNQFYSPIAYINTPLQAYLFQILKETVTGKTLVNFEGKRPKAPQISAVRRFFTNGFTLEFTVKPTDAERNAAITFIHNRILTNSCGNQLHRYLEALAALYALEGISFIRLEELQTLFEFSFLKNLLFVGGLTGESVDQYRKLKVKRDMIETLPKEPRDYFPLARCLKRKFILHVGPTNSGKTYQSLERFRQSGSGVYLAPLRLLALEVQEKMLVQNLPCNLLTGEDKQVMDGARHVASTIEKLSFSQIYDVAIIDECQLLENEQRGAAWTAAILGVAAAEVHACMSDYARDLVIELIEYCGDSYEIIEHSRDTELQLEEEPFTDFSRLEKGDAVIVFTRASVLTLAAKINKETSLRCSVLFGGLPYRSRRSQFHDFAEGKTDVLVTTDVIGLGVNLAIKRIIFMAEAKFDGREKRLLKPAEVLQIAGRAGRKNMYEQGTILSKKPEIFQFYREPIAPLTQAYIGLTHYISEIEGELGTILAAWEILDFKPPFIKANIDSNKKLLETLKSIDLSKSDLFKAIFIPIYTTSRFFFELLDQYLRLVAAGEQKLPFPMMPQPTYRNGFKDYASLQQLHDYSLAIDLYYYLCQTYQLNMDAERVEQQRNDTARQINRKLLPGRLKSRQCQQCGAELEWDDYRNICPVCREKTIDAKKTS